MTSIQGTLESFLINGIPQDLDTLDVSNTVYSTGISRNAVPTANVWLSSTVDGVYV